MQLHSAAYQDTHQLACIAAFQDMYQHSQAAVQDKQLHSAVVKI
jgi:hypothetical protein